MLKKVISFLCAVILIAASFSSVSITQAVNEMRGIWISTVYNIDFPKKAGISSKQMKKEIDEIISNTKKFNLNTIFFQVRPMSDSFCKSSIFPWSKYLTGIQGKVPDDNFDPLEYIIKKAHENKIELHAWINPFRVCKNNENDNINNLCNTHPAKKHPEWTVPYADGITYFNPAIPEVRELIISGAVEIVKNYDVDGIHMDDYFYPQRKKIKNDKGESIYVEFDDEKEYKKYGNGMSLDDFRRDNVNKLIKNMRERIKKIRKDVKFGVSPFGVWANKSTISIGSDTNGLESYTSHYADTRLWVKNRWLDYILPQIYWSFDFSKCRFDVLTSWWNDVCKGTGVSLYIGHAVYKTSEWKNADEIINQIDYARKNPAYAGSVFFGYSDFVNNTYGIADKITKKYNDGKSSITDKNNNISENKNDKNSNENSSLDTVDVQGELRITEPSNNYITTDKNIRILGYADPSKPLSMDSKKVPMSKSGYFGVYVPLNIGKNVFTFKSGDKTVNYCIIRQKEKSLKPLSEIKFVENSLFPARECEYKSGSIVELSALAPANSIVTASVFGKKYVLNQAEKTKDNVMYPVRYAARIILPKKSGYNAKIKYTLSLKGIVREMDSKGTLGINDRKQSAYITADNVIVKPRATDKTFPEVVPVNKNTFCSISAKDGEYYLLTDAGYINKKDIEIINKMPVNTRIIKSSLKDNDNGAVLKIQMNTTPLYKIRCDDENIYVIINNNSLMSNINCDAVQNKLISKVFTKRIGMNIIYTLKVLDMQEIAGIESRYSDNVLTVNLKKRKIVNYSKPDNKRLDGIRVLVDAGHGKTSGAVGPGGADGPVEKDITLVVAKKVKQELEKNGACVIMSRNDDSYVELSDRTKTARENKADIFLSIHLNSVDYSASPFASGLNVYYTSSFSKKLAEDSLDKIGENSFLIPVGVHCQNFAVTRDYYCPAVLLELGYICNPYEYEELIKDDTHNKLAKGICESVIKYFDEF